MQKRIVIAAVLATMMLSGCGFNKVSNEIALFTMKPTKSDGSGIRPGSRFICTIFAPRAIRLFINAA